MATIYLVKYGTAQAKKVGDGKMIGLHLNDQWLTMYHSFTHSLILQNTVSSTLKHTIKLANVKNPYFIPQVVMSDPDTIFYTDINKEGVPGLLRYKLNATDVKLVYKESSPNRSLEICLDQKLFLMSYGNDPLERRTFIDTVDMKNEKNLNEYIYESKENDTGSLICDFNGKDLFFVKTYRRKTMERSLMMQPSIYHWKVKLSKKYQISLLLLI